MIAGGSGTSRGCNAAQIVTLTRLVSKWPDIVEVHHGDCIGFDEQLHEIVRRIKPKARIIGHPPTNPDKRAFCSFDEELEPEDYLVRNRTIVRVSTEMFFCPQQFMEVRRSGTWATIRYAKLSHRKSTYILPDGRVETWASNTPTVLP